MKFRGTKKSRICKVGSHGYFGGRRQPIGVRLPRIGSPIFNLPDLPPMYCTVGINPTDWGPTTEYLLPSVAVEGKLLSSRDRTYVEMSRFYYYILFLKLLC